MNVTWRFLVAAFFAPWPVRAQTLPTILPDDRIRLIEVFRLADFLQDDIWKDWKKSPFTVLLIARDHEFLLRHPGSSAGFDTLGYDESLASVVLFRKRQFEPNLLATFPAVGGVSTIVVGQREKTAVSNSTSWIVTLLHEHFHQMQQSQPDYFSATEALGLSRGDQSGMWMLNYPFPYDSSTVARAFSKMCQTLSETLHSPDQEFQSKLSLYREARKKFQNSMSSDDYKYFSFQAWQEGIARYTEYRIAKRAFEVYAPSAEVRSLSDFQPFVTIADSLKNGIFKTLPFLSLAQQKRIAFYTFGAAEGMLLDRDKSTVARKIFSR